MTTTENLVIFTGTNSELAKPFVDYFSRQIHTKIIATFNNRPIALTDTIIPVQVDLQNRKETQDKISKVLQEQQLHDLKKVYIMHMIGAFKYEGKDQIPEIDVDADGIDDEVYGSNITVFDNIYDIIHTSLFVNDFNHKQLYLFNIGSKRDYDPSIVPWRSYAIVKNMLRDKFKILSNQYPNIHSLFINASTIDILKERQLRPFGEYNYRLSIDEVYQKSIKELPNLIGNKEVEMFVDHPKYSSVFQYETLEDTHNRWVKEMGI